MDQLQPLYCFFDVNRAESKTVVGKAQAFLTKLQENRNSYFKQVSPNLNFPQDIGCWQHQLLRPPLVCCWLGRARAAFAPVCEYSYSQYTNTKLVRAFAGVCWCSSPRPGWGGGWQARVD